MPRRRTLESRVERRRRKSARSRETPEQRNIRLANCRERMKKRRTQSLCCPQECSTKSRISKDSNGSSFQYAFEKALEAISTTEPKELDGRIECEVCKGIFFMRHHYDSHICNNKAKHLSCSICQKTFKSRYRLRQHSYLHSGEKPVECKICKKRFSSTYIWRHTQTHSNKKRYKCKICGKSYRFSDSLNSHMYSHTGEKPHKCKYCGRQFRVKSILRVNLTTHDEETNTCPIYPRLDSQKSVFTRDNFIFKCRTCSRTILRQSQLKLHLRIHKDYECVICSKDYRNCSCTDDYMEVSRSMNTYQKSSRTFTKTKCHKECTELNENIVPKEEPKEECIDYDGTEGEPSSIKEESKEIEQ